MSLECPTCGMTIPDDSPSGLCPRCLFQQIPLTGDVGDGATKTQRGFRAPTVAELAPYFPQLELVEMVGQGGMGAVYQARQPGLDRYVALKILATETRHDAAFAERFGREARVLARLNHPHIVNVHDSGRAGPYFYLLMEYVEGVNLRAVLNRGDLSPAQALAIVPQICDALQYAHEEGVVHRDIKPENILLDRRGRVKVADFGLAKLVQPGQFDDSLTGTHQVMGTPRYMAPEQLEGSHLVDHRADIFSLGVVFYELLTGELPLGRFSPPSHRSGVDARLDEVVLRTLEKEPDRRYQHASDVKTDLESLGAPTSPRIPPALIGYEYRSEAKLLGLPLVHVVSGFDPETGRPRCAVGVIAVGPRAVGGLAIGGGAVGIASIGGVSAGLFSLGGCSLGLLVALGGLAVGLGVSAGGCAIGLVAFGGCAAGIVALGGAAFGIFRMGGNVPGGRNFEVSPGSWGPWMPGTPNMPWGDRAPWGPPVLEGGAEIVHGGPTVLMLIPLAFLGLAVVGMFFAAVAGVILAIRAGRRREVASLPAGTGEVRTPEEYRPPMATKKLPVGGRSDSQAERPPRNVVLTVLLLFVAVHFLLVFLWGMGTHVRAVPLIVAVVAIVGAVAWFRTSPRSCLLTLGIGSLILLFFSLLVGSYLFTYRVEIHDKTQRPASVEPPPPLPPTAPQP